MTQIGKFNKILTSIDETVQYNDAGQKASRVILTAAGGDGGGLIEVTLVDSDGDNISDSTLNALKVVNENPEWIHYTSVEHIVDETNESVANNYHSPEIFMEGYKNLEIQLTGSTGGSGVVFRIHGTLNPSAATPAAASAPSADWVDLGTAILGAGSVTLDGGASGLYYVNNRMIYKYIISYDIDNATNTTDIFIRRH